MLLALIKLLARIGNINLIHLVGSRYVAINDDIHGRVLVAPEIADVIVSLQQENTRLVDELELQRRLNR